MDGLDFQTALAPAPSDPARADIALFAGFVRRRPVASRVDGESDAEYLERLPADLRLWFERWDWIPGRHGRRPEDLVALDDVPVPLESWESFDALFEWDRRPLDPSGRFCESTLGAAVRRFFRQGGRRAYVVRLGDPWLPLTPLAERAVLRNRILAGPGSGVLPPSPVDRSTWRGIAHVFGLPDVSFLCVPDLPELFSVDVAEIPPDRAPDAEERFLECNSREEPETTRSLRRVSAPRLDVAGFEAWSGFVRILGDFVRRHAPEVQVLAALPLSVDDATLAVVPDVLTLDRAARRRVVRSTLFSAQRAQWREAGAIATSFVQLAYPWLRTTTSGRLPGDVEPPDAFLAGILAQNALTSGTWRSVSRWQAPELTTTLPVLSRSDLERELPLPGGEGQRQRTLSLRQRVSVFAQTPRGHQLLSDVTTDDDEAYRPANIHRLVASILRAARRVGEDAVFDNNGEALWDRLRGSIEGLLLNLWSQGALEGENPADAYDVRCDRSTMSQNDIDAGRVVTRVRFTAAAPIERITIVLALEDGGGVTLQSSEASPSPASGTVGRVS